jgi:hypothetical protein
VFNFHQILDATGTPIAFTAGDKYAIDEPAYELNKWAGRRLLIDGTAYWITASDADTLFITPTTAPIATYLQGYSIEEPAWSTVWKFTTTMPTGNNWWPVPGGYLTVPTGSDTTRLGVLVPAPFVTGTGNLESWARDFGLIRPADAITKTLFAEMASAIFGMGNQTTAALSFVNYPYVGATPENNCDGWNPPMPPATEFPPSTWQNGLDAAWALANSTSPLFPSFHTQSATSPVTPGATSEAGGDYTGNANTDGTWTYTNLVIQSMEVNACYGYGMVNVPTCLPITNIGGYVYGDFPVENIVELGPFDAGGGENISANGGLELWVAAKSYWNNFGAPISWRQWQEYASFGASTGQAVVIGPALAGTIPPEPTCPMPGDIPPTNVPSGYAPGATTSEINSSEGWSVANAIAVLTYGFTYHA